MVEPSRGPVDQDGRTPLVLHTGRFGSAAVPSRSVVDLDETHVGRQVVLMFDMDEPGREAAAECAPLFSPGKCAIAELPVKDAVP